MTKNKDILEEELNQDEFELDENINNSTDDSLLFDDFGYSGESSTPMDKYGDLLKQLTNFDQWLKEAIMDLLGLEWDEDMQKWVVSEGVEARINKKGAKAIITFLKIYARKNNIITTMGEEQFMWIHQDLINEVYITMGDRMEDYGIPTEADLSNICHLLYTGSLLVMFGAEQGKYNQLLSQTTMRHENVSLNPNQQLQQIPLMGGKPQKNGWRDKIKKFIGVG